MERNTANILTFVGTTVLYKYINSLTCRNDINKINPTIRMCNVKYIGNFITALFIQPLKGVIL